MRQVFTQFVILGLGLLISCGYQIVGSKSLHFDSVTIRPVQNKTYEPRLEEALHKALSEEFMSQGIKVVSTGGDLDIETTIKAFELDTIAIIDEDVYEQSIRMSVDVRVIGEDRVIEFTSLESPIKITFQTTGTVSETVMRKEGAIEKACREIAGEIVGRMFVRYVE
jgi:hypothetical protein